MPYILTRRLERSQRDSLPGFDYDLPVWTITYTTKDAATAARVDPQLIHYVSTDADYRAWNAREVGRMADGTYTPLPSFWPQVRQHYAHLWEKSLIRFTPDNAHGHEDRKIKLTPAKYLIRLANEGLLASHLENAQDRLVQRLARHLAGEPERLSDAYGEIRWATSADEIAAIYCTPHSPQSCMDGRHFRHSATPVRAYATGDLSFAWLGDETDDPKQPRVYARAIVWRERNLFGRIYPDPDGSGVDAPGATLRKMLETDGMTQIGQGGFAGARVRYNGNRVPYIDWHQGAILNGDWLTLVSAEDARASRYTHHVQRTDGASTRQRHQITCRTCNQLSWPNQRSPEYCDACAPPPPVICVACSQLTTAENALPAAGGSANGGWDHVCQTCRTSANYTGQECRECGATGWCRLEHGRLRWDQRVYRDICPTCARGR